MKPIKVKAEVLDEEASEDAIEVDAVVVEKKRARKLLEARYDEAAETISSVDKVEDLLRKMEEKLAKVPVAGEELAKLSVLASMVHSYATGKYKEIPLGSILAATAAIIYFVSPVDVVPDAFGALGLADDAAVIAACVFLVKTDIEDYIVWRDAN